MGKITDGHNNAPQKGQFNWPGNDVISSKITCLDNEILSIHLSVHLRQFFVYKTSLNTVEIKVSNYKNINCLILDKSYLANKNILNLKIKKYYYTIKSKSEFNKFKKSNNLIFENL